MRIKLERKYFGTLVLICLDKVYKICMEHGFAMDLHWTTVSSTIHLLEIFDYPKQTTKVLKSKSKDMQLKNKSMKEFY